MPPEMQERVIQKQRQMLKEQLNKQKALIANEAKLKNAFTTYFIKEENAVDPHRDSSARKSKKRPDSARRTNSFRDGMGKITTQFLADYKKHIYGGDDLSLVSQVRPVDELRSHERLYPKYPGDDSLCEPSYLDKTFEIEVGGGVNRRTADYFGDCEVRARQL